MDYEGSAGKDVYQEYESPSLNPGTHIKSCQEPVIPALWGLLTQPSFKFSEEYGRDLQSGMNACLQLP